MQSSSAHRFVSRGLVVVTSLALALGVVGCGDPGPTCATPRDLAALAAAGGDITLTAMCSPYVMSRDTTVSTALTIEPGVAIEMAPDTTLSITGPGSLVANGTAAAPVVVRAQQGGPWRSLALSNSGNDRAPARLELHHTRLAGGGASDTALVSQNAGTPLLLDDVTLSQSAGWGLDVHTPLAAASSGVRVESPAMGVARVNQSALTSLPSLTVDTAAMAREIVVESGAITASGTVRSQPVALHVLGSLNITAGTRANTAVTVAGPNRILLAPGETFSVGAANDPTLGSAGVTVERGVTLDCAGATCTWAGVSFHNKVAPSSLTETVIARAMGGEWEESSTTPSTFYTAPIGLTDTSIPMDFSFPTLTGVTFMNLPTPTGANRRVVAVVSSTDTMPPAAYSALPMGSYWYHHP